MPLQAGSDQKTISHNIGELVRAGHDPKQAAAIAYSHAGEHHDKKKVKDCAVCDSLDTPNLGPDNSGGYSDGAQSVQMSKSFEHTKVVFVSGAPDAYEFIKGEPFAREDARALESFVEKAQLKRSDYAVEFAIDEFLVDDEGSAREPGPTDIAKAHEELKAKLAKHQPAIFVAVGKAARSALGSLSDIYLPPLHTAELRPEEFGRKSRQLRKRLDEAREHKAYSIELAKADASSQPHGEHSSLARIFKAEPVKRVVYGVVLDPYQVDAHNDWIPPSDIEKTAHGFAKNSRLISLQHTELADARMVETFVEVYPSDDDYVKAMRKLPHRAYRRKFGNDFIHSGAWVLGVELSPALWEQFKNGEINAFSIEGFGLKVPTTPEAMPEVKFIEIGTV